MEISPDRIVFWQHGAFVLNATIVYTWGLMLVMTGGSLLVTRRLQNALEPSRWQSLLEIIVLTVLSQIENIGLREPRRYLDFLGTLFLFVAAASLCTIIPGYTPPTGSLSTTAALALGVFCAVPYFGIRKRGLGGYLRSYLKPSFIMLPFNVISEVSRTFALAVRLFGNMMSGSMLVGLIVSLTPFLFPIVLTALGLLTGMVQAYIFAVLAAVYIAAAAAPREEKSVSASDSATGPSPEGGQTTNG